jgi:N6-L-threonylcarbamoyladenine synthase
LSIAWNKPLIGVNHVEAHLYVSMMGLEDVPMPALGLVLSGGHTLLLKILDVGKYEIIGTTVDDAIGEAFDKVATLLGLSYPGGPEVEKLALLGDPKAYPLTAGRVKKNPFDFSFSGLKTAVMYTTQKGNIDRANLAASFQETALKDVVKKALLASKTFAPQAIFLGGGVCNNMRLRELFRESFSEIPCFWPPLHLSADNAAMIAGLGAREFLGISDPLDLDVSVRIPIA